MFSQLARRWKGVPIEELVLVSSLTYMGGSETLHRLRALKTDVKVSKLMVRLAIRTFSPQELRQHLTTEEIAWDKTNLKAAMEEQVKQPMHQDQRVIKFLAMLVPP